MLFVSWLGFHYFGDIELSRLWVERELLSNAEERFRMAETGEVRSLLITGTHSLKSRLKILSRPCGDLPILALHASPRKDEILNAPYLSLVTYRCNVSRNLSKISTVTVQGQGSYDRYVQHFSSLHTFS